MRGEIERKSVVFTGLVQHDNIPEYLAAMDIVLAPYPELTFFYYSPLKIFEYMACSKPVVTGNTEGNKDIIAESNAGLVVRPERAHELASAIIKLLNDKQLSQQLGGNGRRAVIERYSWTNIARRVSEVLREAIKEQA